MIGRIKSKLGYLVWWARSTLALRRLARESSTFQLNLGCGSNPTEGWINLDIERTPLTYFWNGKDRLPFRDGTVRAIYTEHMFEHLDLQSEALPLLAETKRVLQPGGVLRIVVPDAEKYIRGYVGDWQVLADTRPLEKVPGGWRDVWLNDIYQTKMQLLNAVFHQKGEHKYAYDAETLTLVLRNSGFNDVQVASFGQSNYAGMVPDTPARARESLYLEAIA